MGHIWLVMKQNVVTLWQGRILCGAPRSQLVKWKLRLSHFCVRLNEGHTMFVERKITSRLNGGEPLRHFLANEGWKTLQEAVSVMHHYFHIFLSSKFISCYRVNFTPYWILTESQTCTFCASHILNSYSNLLKFDAALYKNYVISWFS